MVRRRQPSAPHPLTRRALIGAAGGAMLGGCFHGVTPPTASVVGTPHAYPDAVQPGLIVGAEEIMSRVMERDPSLRLLDARPLREHRAGHLPGARHVWWQDTMERNDPIYGTVLKPEDDQGAQRRRQQLLEEWGITPGSRVVVYDNERGFRAARIVWFLSFLGFEGASLLDGGVGGWLGAGGPLTTDEAASQANTGTRVEPAPREEYYLLYEQVLNRLVEPDTVLCDIRSDAEAVDTVGGTVEVGWVPEAKRLPWPELLAADGRLRPASELARRATNAGLAPTQRVILLGRFATDCALAWLGLRLIGFDRVPIYDGGWTEWVTQPGAPVASLD